MSTPASQSPIPEDMLSAIIKTFTISHTDDGDEQLAQALVYNASRLAWRMRAAGLSVEQKTSISDVVTAADVAAERLIAEALRALRPEDGILGEEGTLVSGTSGRTWVIDPVDGTYNFSTGSDYWCSALALIDDAAPAGAEDADALDAADLAGSFDTGGQPVAVRSASLRFGAVHRPDLGYTWFGGPTIPTTRDGQPIHCPDLPAAEASLSGYIHPTDLTTVAEAEAASVLASPFLRVAEEFATIRMRGSASVDLAGVAGGEAGCWMQRSVAAWDWLPGRALVEGAGGATLRVAAGGSVWSIAGAPQAVERTAEVLRSL